MASIVVLGVLTAFAAWIIGRRDDTEIEESLLMTQRSKRIETLWTSANNFIREGKFLEAENALLVILDLDPQNVAAFNKLGIIYSKQKEYRDALKCFTIACNLEEDPCLLHNLGLVYFHLEQYERACSALDKVLKIDPSAIRYVEYSKILERLGRNRESLEALEQAAELEPKPEIFQILIQAYRVRGLEAEALDVEDRLKNFISKTVGENRLTRNFNQVV